MSARYWCASCRLWADASDCRRDDRGGTLRYPRCPICDGPMQWDSASQSVYDNLLRFVDGRADMPDNPGLVRTAALRCIAMDLHRIEQMMEHMGDERWQAPP